MSHVSRLSPALATALLGTTAAIQLPLPAEASDPTAAPVHRFQADADELNAILTRGLAAARALIADPRPYRLNVDSLKGMVEAISVIAEAGAVERSDIAIPADAYEMLRECIRAERARCYKRGEAWAVAETVAKRAAEVMFAFSEARRQVAADSRATVTGEA